MGKILLLDGADRSARRAGIGFTTALAVASQAPGTLILASRTESKLVAAAQAIAEKYPSVEIKTVVLDLASIDSIKKAASEIDALVDHVDALINNAGVSVMSRSPVTTPNGTILDMNLFTNHLGVFLFTTLLLPKLRAAPGGAARIVNLSSHGHRLSPVRFSDYAFLKDAYDGVPESERPARPKSDTGLVAKTNDGHPGFLSYGQSKTANILHAAELSRRLLKNGDGIVALSVHPGTISTELSRDLDSTGREAISKTAPFGLWKTQDQGGATSIVAAFDPKLSAVDFAGGAVGYLADCQLRDDMAATHAANPDLAARLWDESEKMLQISTGL